MPAAPVVTVARLGVLIGFAFVGLGFWLLLLGGRAAAQCAAGVLMSDRGCASAAAIDPAMAAPVFFGAGAVVVVGGIATLVTRRVRSGSTRRRS